MVESVLLIHLDRALDYATGDFEKNSHAKYDGARESKF